MKQKITIVLIMMLLQTAIALGKTPFFTDCSDAEVNVTTGKIREASRGCDASIIGTWQYQTLTGTTWTTLLSSQVVPPGLPSGNQSVVSQWITPLLPTGTYLFKLVYSDGGAGGTPCESDQVQLFISGGVLASPNLTSFTAIANQPDVKLAWEMKKDDDVDRYSIQRSTDGVNFAQISMAFSADATSSVRYSYTDKLPAISGVLYYRLQFIYKSGKTDYTSIASVRLGTVSNLPKLFAFPNPVNITGLVQLTLDGAVPDKQVFTVYSVATGQLALQQRSTNGQLHLSTLPVGAYIITATTPKGEKVATQIIKQ